MKGQAFAIALVLVSCGQDSVPAEPLARPQPGDAGRFEVRFTQVIEDHMAYGDRRAIYIMKDRTTGKEYVGLSGVGITELGSHSDGESKIEDER